MAIPGIFRNVKFHVWDIDIIWYNMIYLITGIGFIPGGSRTVHVYKQTTHRITQWTQTIHRTTQLTQTIRRTTQLTQTMHKITQLKQTIDRTTQLT